jgi:hypothetical protein
VLAIVQSGNILIGDRGNKKIHVHVEGYYGYVGPRLQSSIQKCYGHHHELDNCYVISFYMYVDLFISSITDKNVTRLAYRALEMYFIHDDLKEIEIGVQAVKHVS